MHAERQMALIGNLNAKQQNYLFNIIYCSCNHNPNTIPLTDQLVSLEVYYPCKME